MDLFELILGCRRGTLISASELLRRLKRNWRLIPWCILGGILIGVVIILLSPSTYKSKGTYAVEEQSISSPDIIDKFSYHKMIGDSFYWGLLSEKVLPEEASDSVRVLDYISKPAGIDPEIINLENRLLSEDVQKGIKYMRDHTMLYTDDKNGTLQVEARFEDAEVSRQLVEIMAFKVQRMIISRRMESKKINADNLAKEYRQADSVYRSVQLEYARRYDHSYGIATHRGRIQLDSLQFLVKIARENAFRLRKWSEEARMKVNSPEYLLAEVSPPVIAEKKSSPRMKIILVYGCLVGLWTGVAISILRK